MTLSLSRRVAETDRKMRAGQALRSVDFMARSLSGRTIGLVGMGSIAREGTSFPFLLDLELIGVQSR